MLLLSILQSIGVSVYISADRGAGPRDSLMLFLVEKTGWKLAAIRRSMELSVLVIGWLLGGPVSFGTVIFGLTIGTLVGKMLPIFQGVVNMAVGRGPRLENINKRKIRVNNHDGAGEELR